MSQPQNLTSVVTGGASGIGFACVKKLLARGDDVTILDLQESLEKLARIEPQVRTIACDVRSEESVNNALDTLINHRKIPNILINSAGILQRPTAPEDMPMSLWDEIVAVNQRGTYLSCQVFGSQMAKRGAGAIVNIASITGWRSTPLHSYGPTKAAILSITQNLASEWGPSGVRVNSISPGYTLTPALEIAMAQRGVGQEIYADPVALKKLVLPADVANAAAFLTSNEASAITGIDLPVDAGWLVGLPWATYGGVPAAR
jgi:NAD(P)-dependent dehydrogenase (short-subunit alcohol dehydrogenase family)